MYSDIGLLGELNKDGELVRAYGFNPVSAERGLWSGDLIWQIDVFGNSLRNESNHFSFIHTDQVSAPFIATNANGDTVWSVISKILIANSPAMEPNLIWKKLRIATMLEKSGCMNLMK
ncbi:hypothetical protein G7047_09970 [Diaphorobacter sp. HDW4A]|uniref:hypothetical protein n=1 Tax=Diaphorobacter sp. HDW4A TaxID=2714924 RepID=UPI001409380A|nr:hypothetical protein [Diaphorobacter sp. HDW4A]QIL80192.1 hypothetical protein G7047_09970 [Diaphorobacter sp. HDW4A]